MNESNPNWEHVVTELLKAHGGSQVELQRVTGVAQQHISAIKRGIKGDRLSYKMGYALMSEDKRIKSKA